MKTEQLFAQAVDRAVAIMEKALAGLAPEPAERDELRARFEELMAAPDDATYEQLRALGERQFGPDWLKREQMLKLRREEMNQ